MKKLELYTGNKNYTLITGKIATPEFVYAKHPAAKEFPFVVGTDVNGHSMQSFNSLDILRTTYNIDDSLSNEEAIAVIEEIMNTPPVPVEDTVSDETRIADALEDMVVLQELNAMEV